MASSKHELPSDGSRSTRFGSKTCTLGVHTEEFSKREFLLNESLFHSWKLKHGTTLQLSPVQPRVRKNSTLSLDSRFQRRGSARSSDVTVIFTYEELSTEEQAKYPNLHVSVSENIAKSLNLSKRSEVIVSQIDENEARASHIEIAFHGAYLTRADMWQLVCSELARKALYRGQNITFLNSVKAQVKSIYRHGNKVTSGFFGPSTKPIFRSESARYVIFLQMSKEMWDFEPEGSGEIMFSKVIDGFLPELFKRWTDIGARHLISIVLFTRMEYRSHHKSFSEQAKDKSDENLPYRDFYRVLTSNMESGYHEAVLVQLKKDFKTFLRDVSTRSGTDAENISLFQDGFFVRGKGSIDTIRGHPAPATRGNILEAINTASSQFSEDHIDRDLLRTGLSIVIVTPGTGVFEVDAGLLNLTTDFLIENGVGIDLVCLARMPLHSVPLFKYRKVQQNPIDTHLSAIDRDQRRGSIMPNGSVIRQPPNIVLLETSGSELSDGGQGLTEDWNYAIPHWLDISFWTPRPSLTSNKNIGIRNFSPSKTKTFLTRVKMYEIQMMGVMENETNGVSIPYLDPYKPLTSRRDMSSGFIDLQNRKSLSNIHNRMLFSESLGSRNSGSLAGSPSASPRSPHRMNDSANIHELQKWMEKHDGEIFRVPKIASPISIEEARPSPVRSKTTEAGAVSKPARPSTSHEKQIEEAHRQKRPPLLGSIPSKSSAAVMTRKPSNASLLKPGGTLFGSVKGNRPAGLGFKGFGSTSTKASASIELSSETAHRESLLTHALKSLPTPAKIVNSDAASIHTVPEERPSPRTSIEEDRSPSRPISPSSKPIVIRNPVKEIHGPHESNSLTSNLAGSLTPKRSIQLSNSDELNMMTVPQKKSTLLRALTPWFTILNPSNPSLTTADPSSRLGRWHHVFPRPLHTSTIKWKSLCAPASIPLTTEGFPSADQLSSEYESKSWTVSDSSSSRIDKSQPDIWLFRELICSRLSNGYQVVIGSHISEVLSNSKLKDLDIFNDEQFLAVNSPIYMSRGVQIHRLTLQQDKMVEIKQYTRIRGHGIADDLGKKRNLVYTPHVKTSLSTGYEPRRITISTTREAYDWRRLDIYVAGREQEQELDMPEELRYWRARYVLIPMQPSSKLKKMSQSSPEDNDEEIRLEGLYKLTQLWQKNRFAPVKEAHQRVVSRAPADTNPLDILFRTRPPSAVVASELEESLLEKGPADGHPRNLLPESELLTRSSVDIKVLAQLLQGEKGIKMQDRRWHIRNHRNCFIGLEFVTWLVDNFKDIDSREIAVEFGEQLMKEGLFIHVERRHNFRDGNFFYSISPEYRRVQPLEKSFAWLRAMSSAPPTPVVDTRYSPNIRPQSSDEDTESEDGSKTPTEKYRMTKAVLSKKLTYDVDRRKKSYRRELIDLHYDRISSADDCYHIRINWLNVTPKLVEDAVSSWASAVERYGLRLVEIPISEASRVNEVHTFRSPYIITLAKQPPISLPRESDDSSQPNSKTAPARFPYHKALLKKFNFVLDLEAAKDFPESVDVSYSWGKPDYHHPQFISRDGVLLAQITDDGNILLLANRLSNNRRGAPNPPTTRNINAGLLDTGTHKSPAVYSTAQSSTNHCGSIHGRPPSLQPSSARASPYASPMVRATPDVALGLLNKMDMITPLTLKDPLEAFCNNAKLLDNFYEEVRIAKNTPFTAPNTPDVGPVIEGGIFLPPVPPLRDVGLSGKK